MEKHPTDSECVDFKMTAESGDVVVIRGDYTKISKFTGLNTPYDPDSFATAAIYDGGKKKYHTEVFYSPEDFRIKLDIWAVSVLSGMQ